mmetsp:Transcript_19086/g.34719  ORF Transcript_19086/g.34719 Transcript_19086/m.34719 type:complete len:102 (-) Transcript_19086:881-1186(-)
MIYLDIARRLGEDHLDLVQRIVECLGEDQTLQLLEASIEAHGTLKKQNGELRSLGGCFMFLAKGAIPKALKNSVFINKKGKRRRRGRHALLRKLKSLGLEG